MKTPPYAEHQLATQREDNYTVSGLGIAVPGLRRKKTLDQSDLIVLRRYLQDWIDSPVWTISRSTTDADREEINALRYRVRFALDTEHDIREWLADAAAWGIEPL